MMRSMSNMGTILPRFAVFGVATGMLATLVPDRFIQEATGISDVSLWIYALLITFLIDRGITRKDQIKESVLLELTHLRHLHHLAEATKDKTLLKDIDRHITEYQEDIKRDFTEYRKSNMAFRETSHTVYMYAPKTGRQTSLHEEMLGVISEIAMNRQRIIHQLYNKFSPFYWIMLMVTATIMVALLVLNFDTPFLQRLGIWLSLVVIYLPMEMFIRTTQNATRTVRQFEARYEQNIKSIRSEKV